MLSYDDEKGTLAEVSHEWVMSYYFSIAMRVIGVSPTLITHIQENHSNTVNRIHLRSKKILIPDSIKIWFLNQ